jgi:hypothetical protein
MLWYLEHSPTHDAERGYVQNTPLNSIISVDELCHNNILFLLFLVDKDGSYVCKLSGKLWVNHHVHSST